MLVAEQLRYFIAPTSKILLQKEKIGKQKKAIEKQRNLIKNKNKDITDSIKYAANIQSALMPSVNLLDKIFDNYFIFSKPKNIISGDFYWVSEKDNKIIVAVADCTGHGVPGALMSMLGITFLNEIKISTIVIQHYPLELEKIDETDNFKKLIISVGKLIKHIFYYNPNNLKILLMRKKANNHTIFIFNSCKAKTFKLNNISKFNV